MSWLLGYAAVAMAEMDEPGTRALFAFDKMAIPYTQNLRLEMRTPRKHPANPVVRLGPAGAVDAMGVQFYGSVLKEGDVYRMWYVAFDDDAENKVASERWRVAYAESRDGLVWAKPNLGLTEFKGNKLNNLVAMANGPWGVVNVKVIRDERDPDPQRRYKMSCHVYFRHHTRLGTLVPFVSADGLSWQPVGGVKAVRGELKKEDLFLPLVHFEPAGGLYQWQGQFFASGQNAMPGVQVYQGRVCRTYRSADFEVWSGTSSVAFLRNSQNEYLGPGRSREGEQTHEGISVWNRGNVLLGVTGLWHGAKEWRDVTIDLGLVLSQDGVHFSEPKAEWTFIERGPDGAWDQGGLLQGQGFENVGEETWIYYGAWDPRHTGGAPRPRGGVGIAVLPRDRFAALKVDESGLGPGDYQAVEITSELVTQGIAVVQPEFFVNASGLSERARLRLELLNEREEPLAAWSGENAVRLEQDGFRLPVRWPGGGGLPPKVKLRVVFEGADRRLIGLHAIYLTESK